MPAIWNPDAAARTQRLHRVWIAMRSRCHTPSNPSYKDYGGRGIVICEAWADFGVFREWAFSAGYEEGKGLTLERIANDGNYEPSNCRWATMREQNVNRRDTVRVSAFGETKAIKDWWRDPRCQISYPGLRSRIVDLGWDPELAITAPRRGGMCQRRHPLPADHTSGQPCLECAEAKRIRTNNRRRARRAETRETDT